MTYTEIRESLKKRRLSLGLSTYALAVDLGYERGTIRGWEVGRRIPSAQALVAWANSLDFEIEATQLPKE